MLTGVLLALAAAACFECSYVLQALVVRAAPEIRRPSLRALRGLAGRPPWLAALGLGLAGFGLQVLALRHAPLTLVQPLLATGLLGLLAFSALVLHERVGRREIVAVAGIAVGLGLVALADPARGTTTSASAFVVVAVVLAALAVLSFVLRRPGAGVMVGSAVAADALGALAAAEAARALPEVLPAVAWCALAAAGGMAAVAAEAAALQRRGAARIAPIVMAGQVALPVALAPLLLGERWSATPGGTALVVLGLVLVVIAGAALAASPSVLALGEGEDEVGGERQVGDVAG
jgi:drug/metabolite transporter (DMT)-like permease